MRVFTRLKEQEAMISNVTQLPQDLQTNEFQLMGERVIAWITRYLGDVEYPLLPHIQPGELAAMFPNTPPQQGVSAEHLFELFETIAKNCTHWSSGRFMGYFGLGPSAIGVLFQALEACLNQTRMLWATSPAATELEQVTLGWIRDLLGLPPMFGMLHTNSRVDLALVAALESRGDISKNGLTGMPRFCCYASTEAHGANEKAMVSVGLGKKNLRRITVDEDYQMDPSALRRAIEKDIKAGCVPLMVIATIGTTSTTSIDPVPQIADICEHYGLWLHVDAAYAGLFAIDPEMRWILNGCERADSFTTNPHKTLFTRFGHSIFYIKNPELLKSAFRSRQSAYLMHGSTEGAVDLYDYTDKIPHGFPALTLWMTIEYFGVEGIIERLREQRRLAHLFETWIEEDTQFELMAPTPLSVVCFRVRPHGMENGREINALNMRLMKAINDQGRYFISDTVVGGKCLLRVAIGNIKTSEEDVRGLWEQLKSLLDAEMATVLASHRA